VISTGTDIKRELALIGHTGKKNNFSGSLSYNNFGFKGNGFIDQSEIIRSDPG
jgi:hypothetical protein